MKEDQHSWLKHVKNIFHMVQIEFLHLPNSEKYEIRNCKQNYFVKTLDRKVFRAKF